MFKISFKETPTPCKTIFKEGRKTTVTYRGIIRLPRLWWYMPPEIRRWVNQCRYVDISENIATNMATIYSIGTSRCREDDKYDTILGERIAEARSKYNMYRFIAELCNKLMLYYNNWMYGIPALPEIGPSAVFDAKQHRYIKKGLFSAYIKYWTLESKEIEHIEALLNAYGDGKE